MIMQKLTNQGNVKTEKGNGGIKGQDQSYGV